MLIIMDASIINAKFYKDIFPIWNNDPSYFWAGFWYLYPYLDKMFGGRESIRVLDIGCANGRFFNFLEFCWPEICFDKVGIDFVDFEMVNDFKFEKVDISKPDFESFDEGKFDLITMFGVFHHIQGQDLRAQITNKCASMLSDQSLFVFTRWNFLLLKRLRSHILGPQELKNYGIQLDLSNLELGDYYLKWDKINTSARFANYMDVQEIDQMLNKAKLNCLVSYNADDKNENRNSYFVCSKLPN
jgi:SAM-dependent methyltransferase